MSSGLWPLALVACLEGRRHSLSSKRLTLQIVIAPRLVGSAEVFFYVDELIGEEVNLAAERLDFGFGAAVDFEVELGADAVFVVLAVLAHHDDRRLDGRKHGEKKVEQDERVGVPRRAMHDNQHHAEDDVSGHGAKEEDDEGPGAAEAGDVVGDALAEGFLLVDEFIGTTYGATADDALGDVNVASEDGEHVEPGEGFFLKQRGEIVAVDLQAGGGFGGDGSRLVGRGFKHGGETEGFTVMRCGEDDFLPVFIEESDFDSAGEDDVGALALLASLVDALVGGEFANFNLGGEDVKLVVIEQREERDLAEFFGGAGHEFRQ